MNLRATLVVLCLSTLRFCLPAVAQDGSLAIELPSLDQLRAVWILKCPEVGKPAISNDNKYVTTQGIQLHEMPWGRDRLVGFQRLSSKLKGISGPTVYFPTHNDSETKIGVIGIKSKFVEEFKDLDWPDGFIDPQPVVWTHLAFAAIRQSALPGGHKDGKKFGCWIIDEDAFVKKEIEVEKLVEQGLVSNSEVQSKFKVQSDSFTGYFDTSKTAPWSSKHYPDYVTAFSTGGRSGKVGEGVNARYTKATFLFLKKEAGFRIQCHPSIPNAVIRFPIDEKVSEFSEQTLELKLPLGDQGKTGDEEIGDGNPAPVSSEVQEIFAAIGNRKVVEEK